MEELQVVNCWVSSCAARSNVIHILDGTEVEKELVGKLSKLLRLLRSAFAKDVAVVARVVDVLVFQPHLD